MPQFISQKYQRYEVVYDIRVSFHVFSSMAKYIVILFSVDGEINCHIIWRVFCL